MNDIEKLTKLKTCEACGEQFGCGSGSGKCWCFSVGTDPASLEELAASYSDCLCPKCLEALKEEANG